jgi:hypothetical protein
MLTAIISSADVPKKAVGNIDKIVDSMLGLSSISAETALAMAIEPGKIIHHDILWARKIKAIEQTRGLSCYKGSETFEMVQGLATLKQYLLQTLHGRTPPRCVVLMDEIDKAMAGAKGDSSGVAQDLHGSLLKWLNDCEVVFVILLGIGGTGKTAMAKAFANECSVPLIMFDIAGMKSGIVGSSSENMSSGLATTNAIGQNRIVCLATCNQYESLSPELRRRAAATFFVDLPSIEEQDSIWKVYEKKYDLTGPRPECAGWTGAEIRACCDTAYRLNISKVAAGKYIVPICRGAAESIETLRRSASGRAR